MTDEKPPNRINYPQTIIDWRNWIHIHLDINLDQGRSLAQEDAFPFDNLIKVWKQQFNPQHGFSSNFIPALVRNKRGLIKWVYLNAPEPNWTKSDD